MYVNIAILKEMQPRERRVALVPSLVAKLTKLGAKLHMQSGAADAIRLTESAYGDVVFMAGRTAVVADADVVLCVGGYTKNGGFAEYVLADPNYVAHIPKGLSPTMAAPLICAGITTYKGIKETEARPGEWIAISGCGGLGHLAIQYAKAMGLHVCAVDIDDDKLDHARRLGADLTVNAKTQDPATVLKEAIGGGAHGVLITAPSLPAFKQGIEMTRKRGTCALVGLPPGEFPTPLFDVVAKCITIRGSFVGTRKDMAECLAFAADGKVKADIELQPLSAINDVLKRLENGDVPSRVVLDFVGSGNGAVAAPHKEAVPA